MAHPRVIQLAKDLDSYFENEIRATAKRQGVDLSPHASQYLGRMLTRFSDVRAYLTQHNATSTEERRQSYPTLALLWLEGLSKTVTEQFHQFQLLGDVALFTSGFFADRIKGSAVDMDYYIAMGGRAYERAAVLRDSIQAERAINIFFELSSTFGGLVEVLSEISDQSLLANDRDLLKLYERWLATGSERLRRMLAEKQVISARTPRDGNQN